MKISGSQGDEFPGCFCQVMIFSVGCTYIPFRMLRQSKIADMGILWANIIHRDNTAADAGMNSGYNGMIVGGFKKYIRLESGMDEYVIDKFTNG